MTPTPPPSFDPATGEVVGETDPRALADALGQMVAHRLTLTRRIADVDRAIADVHAVLAALGEGAHAGRIATVVAKRPAARRAVDTAACDRAAAVLLDLGLMERVPAERIVYPLVNAIDENAAALARAGVDPTSLTVRSTPGVALTVELVDDPDVPAPVRVSDTGRVIIPREAKP